MHFFLLAVHEQPPCLFSVTSVSGTQIINNPWVWYSLNIPPLIRMSNHNITKPRPQALVSWSAGALLIAKMGDLIVILRMLAVFYTSTWMTMLWTTMIRDLNAKHRLGKTINLHYTAILGATLHKENIGKEWLGSGKNAKVLSQQSKYSRTKLGQ